MDNGQPDETEIVVKGPEKRFKPSELQLRSLQELKDANLLGVGSEEENK